MFLCRAGRLSAAAFKSTGSSPVQLKANRLRDVVLTLGKGHAFQRYRCFYVYVTGVESSLVHPGKQQQQQQQQQQQEVPDLQPVHNWDSPSGFVTTHRGHLDRAATVAANLSRSVRSDAGLIRQTLVRAHGGGGGGGEPAGGVLFTGDWGVSGRRRSTGTTQTRSASTAAAAKKSGAGGERTATSNKEEEQNIKKASTISSSVTKAPGEPEGEKPNKTQQLKKVFKEYGAVGVSFHIGISLMSLGMFYLFISSGIDMTAMLCKLGFTEAVVRSKLAAGTSTFVLAYAIHKLFAPVRISITLVSVPLIVRYFRKTGLFKPPTPAP